MMFPREVLVNKHAQIFEYVVCVPDHEVVKNFQIDLISLTNRMWFSVVCNDTRHHSGQNVVHSQGTADLFFTTIST